MADFIVSDRSKGNGKGKGALLLLALPLLVVGYLVFNQMFDATPMQSVAAGVLNTRNTGSLVSYEPSWDVLNPDIDAVFVATTYPQDFVFMSSTGVAPARSTHISGGGSGYPDPRDLCKAFEEATGEQCNWTADFLEYGGGEKVVDITLRDSSGNVFAEMKAQYVNLNDLFTGLPRSMHGWVTWIKVSAEGLGLGKLAWQVLDGAIIRVAASNALERTVLFIDRAGWGPSLMAKLPPELVTKVGEKIWFYIPPG